MDEAAKYRSSGKNAGAVLIRTATAAGENGSLEDDWPRNQAYKGMIVHCMRLQCSGSSSLLAAAAIVYAGRVQGKRWIKCADAAPPAGDQLLSILRQN